MGFNTDDLPWPAKRPKKQKSGKSGGGTPHQVGMSIAIFGSAGLIGLVTVGYIVWGHLS